MVRDRHTRPPIDNVLNTHHEDSRIKENGLDDQMNFANAHLAIDAGIPHLPPPGVGVSPARLPTDLVGVSCLETATHRTSHSADAHVPGDLEVLKKSGRKWLEVGLGSFVAGTPIIMPIGSMYGIFTYIYHKNQPNVGKYTIHGSYGMEVGPWALGR